MLDQSLDIALDFLRAHPNWYIFPITRLEKLPPHIEKNLINASNDPNQIKAWHAQWRGCNWGLALKKSHCIAMDVDQKPGKIGRETLDALLIEHGDLPDTLTIRSPSGGLHYYFNGEHYFRLGKAGFGVDIDSPNYVLIPGCWLCSNSEQGYEIINDVPVADAPEWFGEYLKEREETTQDADAGEAAIDLDKQANIDAMVRYLKEGAPPSIMNQNGDITTLNVIAYLKDNGISEWMALELLKAHYNVPGKCEPQWNVGVGPDKDRLEVKVHNAYTYLRENIVGGATAEYAFGDPGDAIDESEIKAFDKMWRKQQAAQTKIKAKKDVENRFTDEARGVDPLTGEPFEDQGVIDPLTGEPFKPDDDPPSGGAKKPAGEPSAEETAKQGDAAGTPKKQQTLLWIQANWIWVVSAERFMRLTDGLMWSRNQFDSYYNHLTKRSSMSNSLFATSGIRTAEKLCYRPAQGVMLDQGRSVNLWRPSKIKPKEGDTTVWNEHLNKLFQDEDDRDRVLNWMAWVYRYQDRKPNHGLMIVGRNTGTGKSFIARVLEQLVGPDNTQRPKNSSLKGDFNSWAMQCKLCIIEELMQIGRKEVANELRDTITESTIEVNAKNIQAQKIENYIAMMAITNHRDAMPMIETERRWLVIETFASRVEGDDGEYYRRLFGILKSPDALAAIAHELQTRDLGKFDAALSPDETSARAQMIQLSRSDAESWLYENIDNSPLTHRLTTIQDIVDTMPPMVSKQGRVRAVVQTFVRDKLRGELTRPIRFADGSRKRLWVLHGRFKMLANESDAKLSEIYENERRQAGSSRTQEEQAQEDFGD
jgi:hypothetical protein